MPAVLDRRRSRAETGRLPAVLQRASLALRGPAARRRRGRTRPALGPVSRSIGGSRTVMGCITRRAPRDAIDRTAFITAIYEFATHSRPVRRRLFQVQNSRNPFRCQPTTVSGFTMTRAVRQLRQTCYNHAQRHRSAWPSARRRGRERCSTWTWWRNARTSRCKAARERTTPRSVARTEITTDVMANGAYRATLASSIVSVRSTFLAGTASPHRSG
jgi:hypothetical protein